MLGKIEVVEDGNKAVFIRFAEPTDFKIGQEVDVKKHKRKRSLSQNSLYWAYLTWLISPEGGDLIDQGHFGTDALHENIKAWIVNKYPHQFTTREINKFTTTELNTKEFNEYIELVDRELMVNFFGIDTSKFWGEVEERLPF